MEERDNDLINYGYVNRGTHLGDVNFGNSLPKILPKAGQLGSMCCPRCKSTIWSDRLNCDYCDFDLKSYHIKISYQRDLIALEKKEQIAGWVMAGLFFAMLIWVAYFDKNFLLLILFVGDIFAMVLWNAAIDKQIEIKKKLKKYDYLYY